MAVYGCAGVLECGVPVAGGTRRAEQQAPNVSGEALPPGGIGCGCLVEVCCAVLDDLCPYVALLVDVQCCCAHQGGAQDEGVFAPGGGVLVEVGEEVAAVVVEQRVRGGHGVVAAERVGFGFVDVVGPVDPFGE